MALAPLAARMVPAIWALYGRTLGESPQDATPDESLSVDSSCITQIGYRAADSVITITFKRGGTLTYDYAGSPELWQQFKDAPSKGAFFNANFR